MPAPAVTSPLPTELVVERHWHPVRVPEMSRVTTGDYASPRVGWVAGKQGLLVQTADGGNTWTQLTPGVSGDICRSISSTRKPAGAWIPMARSPEAVMLARRGREPRSPLCDW